MDTNIEHAEQGSRVPSLSPTVVLVLNPSAGRGGAARRIATIKQTLADRGTPVEIRKSDTSEGTSAVAEAAALEGAQVIVACGGDGTVNRVATGLLSARMRSADIPATLAVLPMGTGNDFAKMLGTSESLDVAIDAIVQGPTRVFDSGIVEWDGGEARFVNAFGTGIDVEVVRQIKRLSLPATLTYFVGLARALIRYQPITLRLKAGGSTIDAAIMMTAVGNGRCVGGSFNICPDAEPDDGLFDVCVIRAVPLLATPSLALRIVRGVHRGHTAVEFIRSGDVDIELNGQSALFFQVDGELYEPAGVRHVRVRILPSSLPVRVAPRNRGATNE